jgi:hypothetical protein
VEVSKLIMPDVAVQTPSLGVKLSVHESLSAGTLLLLAPPKPNSKLKSRSLIMSSNSSFVSNSKTNSPVKSRYR